MKSVRRFDIAKNQNTFAKRQREMEKKAKAEAKRIRRTQRKQDSDAGIPPKWASDDPNMNENEDPDTDQPAAHV